MKIEKKAVLPVLAAAGVAAGLWLRRDQFRYAGTVEATEVSLAPRVAAAIATVEVREGDAVHSGQLLATLDCADYSLAADLARKDYERAERLFKEGSVPKEAYDRAQNRRDDTALKVDWCKISSPISGTVLARLHEPGEWAAIGAKLLTLADMDQLYAYFYVPQPVLHKLSPGQEVQVFLPEAKGPARRGKIAFIRPEAEFTPKNVQTRRERERLVFGVKVLLENADRVLKPGMPIEAGLPVE
ncbi:MAG TPA: efflux RND transporter periplasmic adaptor subunit [Elusimicrobiota bacterium]|jgi:HlyD family secretion protein|nr:efflux RND transporter periplasmic adaptor subunit [Elusimicrobiota bacterium]